MKIIYDNEQETYRVVICEPETTFVFNTDDIVEVRGELIKCVTRLFNDAVCEKLEGDDQKENTVCKSDFDHEWECCGVSTNGSNYRCKKCYAHKFVPYTSSSSNHYKGE